MLKQIERFKQVLFWGRIINLIYALFAVAVLSSILVIDVRIGNPYPASVSFPNYFYFGIALLILLLFYIISTRVINLQTRYIKAGCLIVCILLPIFIFVVWQIPMSNWIYYYNNDWDMGSIYQAAIGLNEGYTFADFPYFHTNPNNVNFAIVMSWLYSLVGEWRTVILVSALLANVSCVLVSWAVYNYTKNIYSSTFILIISEVLIAFTWRSYLVYTDIFGMFFVALGMYVLSSKCADKIKIPLVMIILSVGIFIKITISICLIVVVYYFIIKAIRDKKRAITKIVFILASMIICVFLLLVFQTETRTKYNFSIENKCPKTWQYMLCMGQNTETYGTVNRQDEMFFSELTSDNNATIDDVNNILYQRALGRIKERGLWGNMTFFYHKIHAAYCDGYFDNVQEDDLNVVSNELSDNRLYYLYVKEDGKWYQFSAGVMQVVWNLVLIIVFLLGLSNKLSVHRDASIAVQSCKMMILAISLYLLVFENRSKYLLMFLPIFFLYAGIVLSTVISNQKGLASASSSEKVA